MRRAAALLLLPLLAACASSSAPARSEGPLFNGKPLSHYLEEVRDLNPGLKAEAAQALEYFGPAAAPAIPDLIDAMKHGQSESQARGALVAIGPAALPAVEKALFSPDGDVRLGAAQTLQRLVRGGARGPTLVNSLVRGLKDPGTGVARWCVRALAHLAPESPAAVQGLEAALLDERLTEVAKEALGLLEPAK